MSRPLCPDCEGSGFYLSAARVAGEMIDADYAEMPCETCEGTGEVDHICPGDERCSECGSVPLHLLHRGLLDLSPVEVLEPRDGRDRRAA